MRYSVAEAEKYRAAAGFHMAGHHHNLYSADPVAAAAAAKYLEASGSKTDEHNKSDSSVGHYGTPNGGKSSYNADSSSASSDGNSSSTAAASKAYLETAKLYMDSKNYAAEVQRAYMLDAAAKSMSDSMHHETEGIKSERNHDGSASPPSAAGAFNPTTLANYYSQAAAAAAAVGQPGSTSVGLPHHQSPSALSGIVPGLYAPPAGTYPSPGEYRRPLPVIF